MNALIFAYVLFVLLGCSQRYAAPEIGLYFMVLHCFDETFLTEQEAQDRGGRCTKGHKLVYFTENLDVFMVRPHEYHGNALMVINMYEIEYRP